MSWLTLVHVLIQLTAIAIALRLLSALLLGEGAQAFSVSTLAALMLVCAGIISVNRFGNRVKPDTKVQK